MAKKTRASCVTVLITERLKHPAVPTLSIIIGLVCPGKPGGLLKCPAFLLSPDIDVISASNVCSCRVHTKLMGSLVVNEKFTDLLKFSRTGKI